MGPERLPIKLVEEKRMTRKQRERPKKKWIKCVQEDIKIKGITDWNIKAGDEMNGNIS